MKNLINLILLLLIPFIIKSEINIGIISVSGTPNTAIITFEATTDYPASGANHRWNTVAFSIQYPSSYGPNFVNDNITLFTGIDVAKDGIAILDGGNYIQNFASTASFVPLSFTMGQIRQIAQINFVPNSSTTQSISLVNSGTNGGTSVNHAILFEEFNIFSPQSANIVLPVDIKTYSATKDGDRNVRLDWSTSLEINSAYFGIERSTDGNTWEAISKVAAAGNSNTEQLYNYTDRDLPLNRSKDQIFYYRLQLVDLDGWYKYSDIRGVNYGKVNTNKVISLYPNPAVQMVNLDLSGMDLESGAIHLRVTDMQGRNMIDKTILGNGIEPIEVTQLPAGTYNVAVSQGANLYQKQFIKIE